MGVFYFIFLLESELGKLLEEENGRRSVTASNSGYFDAIQMPEKEGRMYIKKASKRS
jgi:hypothetical protein